MARICLQCGIRKPLKAQNYCRKCLKLVRPLGLGKKRPLEPNWDRLKQIVKSE